MDLVKFVVPKGSLWDATHCFLKRAGYILETSERSYHPLLNDARFKVKVSRPQEIPLLVADGSHDLGITGRDWIIESSADVIELLDLMYGRVKIVLAVPESWEEINSIDDLIDVYFSQNLLNTLFNEKVLRIATEYLNMTANLFQQNSRYKKLFGETSPVMVTPWWTKGTNSSVKIILSFGATEAKPPEDADAIVDNTETGRTLKENKLKIIEQIGESTAILIANPRSLKNVAKRQIITDFSANLSETSKKEN